MRLTSGLRRFPPFGDKRPLNYEIIIVNNVLRLNFPLFKNEQELRSAVDAICSEFGKVKSLQILPASRGLELHCACILALESQAAENALRSQFRVLKIAGGLYFFADVSDIWTGLTTQQLKHAIDPAANAKAPRIGGL